jgi:hypothetical protein
VTRTILGDCNHFSIITGVGRSGPGRPDALADLLVGFMTKRHG